MKKSRPKRSRKAVLAYSGGLDTSVAIRWMQQNYGCDVIAVAVDVGEEGDYAGIRRKALKIGAVKSVVVDAKKEFARDFILPALKANAIYEGRYPLATALARPLIAKVTGDIALKEGAHMLAHGATGKGNDQVRFEITWGALFPKMKIIAPIREWGMTREQEIEYAKKNGIPVPVTKRSPYSFDVNLWGKSAEAGPLEDPWAEPLEEVYDWTTAPEKAPAKPAYVEIGFEQGEPVSLDGRKMEPVKLISNLNALAGEHGIGRVDMIENRLVGIKSREVYECPAATVLLSAHRDLEGLCLERELAHHKTLLESKYSELVYYGLWYSPLREALQAFIDDSQKRISGKVRMKLFRGNCAAVGRQSPNSLYRLDLATYDVGDRFDQQAAKGFIELFGMSARVAAASEQSKRRKSGK
ncbi:MAG: argininosuccinate synthase [Armatimonadetes bacterium]|nr:argininosuccinate synthase [Armatimonadota bacterium]NIM23389.1 argininosuccinate synthase [Armatimonadota bacterium]NIM67254.1 argininosuccinate synthase [Armatimonadota bacterium]NIM75752.1 argininosuccinate synthase [Armatimonadota bacterium]NIN05440.1 argininosuccinate synthase [Armatimonadota bacterium]